MLIILLCDGRVTHQGQRSGGTKKKVITRASAPAVRYSRGGRAAIEPMKGLVMIVNVGRPGRVGRICAHELGSGHPQRLYLHLERATTAGSNGGPEGLEVAQSSVCNVINGASAWSGRTRRPPGSGTSTSGSADRRWTAPISVPTSSELAP